MTETNKPLPGTHEARARGCTCKREGWEWNTVDCLLHDERPVPTDEQLRAMGICHRCGERLDEYGGCGECYERGVDHDRTMRSLRPSVPAGRTVSSWRQGEWW